MAFDADSLALVSYGNGQKIWAYKTTDQSATVGTANYIGGTDVVPLLTESDIILAAVSTAAAKKLYVLVVAAVGTTTSTLTSAY